MSDGAELVAWLRREIEADKAAAEAASPGPWFPNDECDEVMAVDDITVCEGFALSNRQLRATVRHIVLHDPDDVIADCDAKLALLGHCEDAEHAAREVSSIDLPEPRGQVERAGYQQAANALRETVRLLAQGYRHRDGWRKEWAT